MPTTYKYLQVYSKHQNAWLRSELVTLRTQGHSTQRSAGPRDQPASRNALHHHPASAPAPASAHAAVDAARHTLFPDSAVSSTDRKRFESPSPGQADIAAAASPQHGPAPPSAAAAVPSEVHLQPSEHETAPPPTPRPPAPPPESAPTAPSNFPPPPAPHVHAPTAADPAADRSGGGADGPFPDLPPYSADPQLSEYWVSGVDGSFPAMPPERLTRYYSIGRTRPFVGDAMQPGVMQEALQRCSFKQEVILMCTDVGDIWFEFVFTQIMMMRERGYAHVIVFMDSRDHCDQFQSYMPGVCCLYSSVFDMDKDIHDFWTPLGRLWTNRWMVVAKGLQLGYNVLHVDNDVMFTTDIYRYLKHPIFMDYQLIALGSRGLIGINCGVVYSHNAHPAGPTSWTAHQVQDRTLRWLENQDYILPLLNTTNRYKLQDIGFEQSVYNDAVWATVSGRPFFAHSLRPDWDAGKMAEWTKFHSEIGPDKVQKVRVRGPQEWAALMRMQFDNTDAEFELNFYDTRLVGRSETEDARLGPPPFPPQRGRLSRAVDDFIRDGVTELWPDWEAGPVDPQLVEQRREKFLLAPDWLMGGWNKDGWHGYWHIDRPHVVLGHMVGIGGKHQQGKKLGFKVGGWWHYSATAMLHGLAIFRSSTPETPYPPLLALDPDILVKAASKEELMRMHLGLIIAGEVSGRVFVWPPLDCHGRRFAQSSDPKHWAGVFANDVLYYGGRDALKCVDLLLTWNYCMEKGMSWPDFQEYLGRQPQGTAKTAANSLRLDGPKVAVSKSSAPDSTSVVSVPLTALKAQLAGLEGHQVVYVSDVFAVSEEGVTGSFAGSCVPNCNYDAAHPGLAKALAKFESDQGCHPFDKLLLPQQ